MEEDITDYIKSVKNNPEERDQQAYGYVQEVKTLHDQVFQNGINSFHTDINTLLLSFFERISYYDASRTSYESYARYASFLNLNPKREKDYEANMEEDAKAGHKGAEGSLMLLKKVADDIPDPSFRVYILLLTVCLFKDIGTFSKKQKEFLSGELEKLQV